MPALFTRRLLLAAAGVAGLAAHLPRVAAAADDPVAFARSLYALPFLWSDATADDEAINRYLSPELGALIRENYAKDDFEAALDYDPLVQAQEADEIKPTFTVENKAGKDASVRVDFENFGEAITLTLDLVLTDDGWRLADVRPVGGQSLVLEVTELNAAAK